MDRLERNRIGKIIVLLGLSIFAFQTGCSSTARQPVQSFQPRPFQAQTMKSQPFSNNSAQQAFYPPAYSPQNGLQGFPTDPNSNQAVYSRNKFGFPFGSSQGLWPNFRPAQNPLGFAGTSC